MTKPSLYLAEYVKNGETKPNYRDIELNKENLGTYTARQMILKIGRQEITMTPVGILVYIQRAASMLRDQREGPASF